MPQDVLKMTADDIDDEMRAQFDMTITRAEFERLLGQAFGTDFVRKDSCYGPGDGVAAWTIFFEPVCALKIGHLCLQRHRVRLDLGRLEPDRRAVWLRRFWLCFQRGGG